MTDSALVAIGFAVGALAAPIVHLVFGWIGHRIDRPSKSNPSPYARPGETEADTIERLLRKARER